MTAKKPTDNVEASKQGGPLTTDEGHRVEATSPAVPHGAEFTTDNAEHKNRVFSPEDEAKYAGELAPGDVGYIELDDENHPIGTAKKGPIPEGVKAARITGVAPQTKPTQIQTPAGAPLSHTMNPSSE